MEQIQQSSLSSHQYSVLIHSALNRGRKHAVVHALDELIPRGSSSHLDPAHHFSLRIGLADHSGSNRIRSFAPYINCLRFRQAEARKSNILPIWRMCLYVSLEHASLAPLSFILHCSIPHWLFCSRSRSRRHVSPQGTEPPHKVDPGRVCA